MSLNNNNNKILRGSYNNEYKIEYFKNQNYIKLKKECLRNKCLFQDPYFLPCNKSLFYSKPIPKGTRWLRPHQILKQLQPQPQFIIDNASADDLDQGTLGNCWLIAGMQAITYMPSLFRKVVPIYQTFDADNYAGIFHFRYNFIIICTIKACKNFNYLKILDLWNLA